MTSFFEYLKSAQNALAAAGSRFANKNVAAATMAACALVAAADGTVSSAEKQKVAAAILKVEQLKAFNPTALREQFLEYVDELNADVDFGTVNLLAIVSKVKDDPEDATTVIQVAGLIAKADGTIDAKELNVIRDIAVALGLNPATLGLTATAA